MIKNEEYINIEYTDLDNTYIKRFSSKLDIATREMISYFKIKNFGTPITIKLIDSKELFIEEISKVYYQDKNIEVTLDIPEWLNIYSFDRTIYTLTFREYKKTDTHKNDSLDDLIRIILREFSNICFRLSSTNQTYSWLYHGAGLTLSHQYDDCEISFNSTIEEMIYGTKQLMNYYAMFKYVFDNYGMDYILHLISDFELLKLDTPRLYEEAVAFYGNRG